jgi:3-oxoacyl-[acyl-carrier-protein] synthase-1
VAKRVFVTGIGAITAVGLTVPETYQSVLSGRSGVSAITLLNTSLRDQLPAAEIKKTDDELAQLAGLDSSEGKTRTTLLGMIAAREAVDHAKIEWDPDINTGLISSTTVGGMCRTELCYNDFLTNNSKNQYIMTHDCGESTERIADYLGLSGFLTTINTACSSSANAIMFGTRLIRNGLLERVIVGGTDSLSKFTLNGFNTLMILDTQPSRPFDENRAGLNLGEGAGYLLLEAEDVCPEDKILCEVKGFGNASDAYHQTASSENGFGAHMAMKNAIDSAGLTVEDIDYINLHGTGTENNDLSEGRALESLFGGNPPKFSSTKPMTGHTLGASGGIEAVLSILALQNSIVYPNLNFETPMKELKITPEVNLIKDYTMRNILSNSFGFGGNNSSLIFSAVDR